MDAGPGAYSEDAAVRRDLEVVVQVVVGRDLQRFRVAQADLQPAPRGELHAGESGEPIALLGYAARAAHGLEAEHDVQATRRESQQDDARKAWPEFPLHHFPLPDPCLTWRPRSEFRSGASISRDHDEGGPNRLAILSKKRVRLAPTGTATCSASSVCETRRRTVHYGHGHRSAGAVRDGRVSHHARPLRHGAEAEVPESPQKSARCERRGARATTSAVAPGPTGSRIR